MNKKYISIICLSYILFMFFSCTIQKSVSGNFDYPTDSLLMNRVIGYSSIPDSVPNQYNFNEFYIVATPSIFILVNRPIGQFDTYTKFDTIIMDSQIDLKPYLVNKPIISKSQFKYIRQGESIFIQYKKDGNMINDKQYSFNKEETTDVFNIREICNSNIELRRGKANYVGKSVEPFSFLGYRLTCLVFEERYIQAGSLKPSIKQLVYLEEHTLLPLRFIYTLYPNGNFNAKDPWNHIYQINFIVNDSNIHSLIKEIVPACN